jgi:hypothetical protein
MRDHISTFRTFVLYQVANPTGWHSWELLSRQLRLEEKDPSQHGQRATTAVQQALQGELPAIELCNTKDRELLSLTNASDCMYGFNSALEQPR